MIILTENDKIDKIVQSQNEGKRRECRSEAKRYN